MVKGITILCIALYHIVAPGIIRNVLAIVRIALSIIISVVYDKIKLIKHR